MKTAFLLNPSPRRKRRLPRLLRLLRRIPPGRREIFSVDRDVPDSTERQLAKITPDKFDRIIVAAGDGTLNRVINVLKNQGRLDDFTLGVIPLGTCNDFARRLGLSPGRLGAAVRTALGREVRRVDLASVNGRWFVNNSGFGKKNPTIKRSNPIAVIREMTPVRLQARWPGGATEGTFYTMLCANAPYFSGGLYFSRKSNPGDGLLEFYFVKKTPKIGLALRLLFGGARLPLQLPLFSRNILRVQAPELDIEAEEPVALVLDGDPVEGLSRVRHAAFRVAGACRFMVPRGYKERPALA